MDTQELKLARFIADRVWRESGEGHNGEMSDLNLDIAEIVAEFNDQTNHSHLNRKVADAAGFEHCSRGDVVYVDGKVWEPTKDWSQLGPLLDRFDVWFSAEASGVWASCPPHVDDAICTGPTRLIAACRAIAAIAQSTAK